MATHTIYLVRHAQTYYAQNSDDSEGTLTPLGIEQAEMTAERFRNVSFTNAYISTLRRAVQTAEIILKYHPNISIQWTKILRECVPNIPPLYADELPKLSSDELIQMKSQAEQAFMTHFMPAFDQDQNTLIVSHGNLIRYFVIKVLEAHEHSWMKIEIYNCAVTIVKIKSEIDFVLEYLNDTSHLSPIHRTSS